MAQSYITDEGTLIIPSAGVSLKVQAENSGLATNGVIALLGEADAGPDYSEEDSLQDNSFGPDQIASVVAKYKSGPLVDAVRAASVPANDPNIPGSPSKFILVKTNPSTKASATLLKYGGGTYATLADKSYGKLGNNIYFSVAAAASEVIPTTSTFTWIPPAGTVDLSFRVNGGASVSPATFTAGKTPAAAVTDIAALSGVLASGGAARTTIQASTGTLALAVVAGNNVTITYAGATFTTTPSVGDTVMIPAASVIVGGSNQNVGAYVVTAATSTVLTCTKLSDANKPGAVPGTITAPTAVGAQAVSGTVANDLVVYGPVTITLEAADPIDGIGKSLEVCELATGTDLLSRCAYQLGTTTAVTWVSKASSATNLTSATEYRATLNVSRVSDNISEELTAGGEIVLKLGYTGTTATVTITDTTLSTTVTGGSGGNLSLTLKDYPTLSDLANYINSQTGYTCAVGTAALGQLSPVTLDNVTTQGICTTHGAKNGRLKVDAYRFFRKLVTDSVAVQLGTDTVEQAAAGLPAPTSGNTYLAGGTKAATTNAIVTAALTAMEKIRCNIVVPLFSRDATDDIADALTESTSTYTIDSINSAVKTHCLKMSTLKRARNRQAILAKDATFALQKEASSNIASAVCAMTFMNVKVADSTATVVQQPSFLGSAVAAGMQAAGFYRNITRKIANISGAVHQEGDFDPEDDTQMEEALQAGLMPLRRSETGGYYWVSDQTTYVKDSNFVWNSFQAVYVSNIIGLTTKERMERAFVGSSTAEVSATLALAFMEAILADFLRLKLIAPSDDAPKGYKNLSVKLSGTALIVSCEVKVAGSIYFVPISFLLSAVQQSATA